MTPEEIAYIVANKERKHGLFYYSFVLGPLALISFGAVFYYSPPSPTMSMSAGLRLFIFCATVVFSIVVGYFIIIRMRQNITFTSIATLLSEPDNYKLAVNILEQKKYTVRQFPGYIECNARISLFSWGEKITVIPLDKEILINSAPSNTGRQPVSLYKDVKNIREFKARVSEAMVDNNDKLIQNH